VNFATVVEKLVQIGLSPVPERAEGIQELVGEGRVNQLGPDFWSSVSRNLTNAELEGLNKGLVVSEAEHGWIGGSATSGIWTYRELERRDKERAAQIADRMQY